MKWLLLAGLVGIVLVVVAFFVVAGALSGGGDSVDCSTFSVEPGDWQAADFAGRQDIVAGLQECRTLHGRTAAEVEALLGPADRRGSDALTYRMPYENDQQFLRVFLAGGRVERLFVETPPT